MMHQIRQLAAIMFTDIAGYTALMQEDEEKAIELLHKNRDLQKTNIEHFGGKWIKELGDGVLASFSTITDSVLCAIDIQKSAATIPGLKLRIGIHFGDVIIEDNDVFGDGVNIASRLMQLAPIGGICISEAVYNNVANKKEIVKRFLREETLKNIKDPMRIYEVIANDIEKKQPIDSVSSAELPKKALKKSIAVLPFINMSNDPEQEYFSDGMAEEILNSLANLKDLKVAGRTSSFQFKGKNIDLREVGEKLGVNTVLEGSVRKQGNQLRVTAQLIDVSDGFHLWSERYDSKMEDIFAIQDEIALKITEKLKLTLLENDIKNITKTPTKNKEAYELYLKGRFYINRRGSSILPGMKYFQQAIDIDPDFALAYAGYADAGLLCAFYSFLPAKEIMPKAKQAAEAAIRLDSFACEPYTSLGFYYAYFEWNWEEAKKNFLTAIELNPKYAQGHYWYGIYYLAWVEGNFVEAEKHAQTAISLEPLSAIAYSVLSSIYFTASKFEEAIHVANNGIELDAHSFLCYRIIGLCYMELNRFDEAIETLQYALKLSNRYQWPLFDLIWANCRKGNIEQAQLYMDELKERSKKENITDAYLSLSAAYLGNYDEAVYYLEKAYDKRDPLLITLKIYKVPSIPSSLKEDLRYRNLLDRIIFPDTEIKAL